MSTNNMINVMKEVLHFILKVENMFFTDLFTRYIKVVRRQENILQYGQNVELSLQLLGGHKMKNLKHSHKTYYVRGLDE